MENRIWVSYQMYQFNLPELYDCYSFCHDLGISFNPHFAFPLLVDERVAYADGSLPRERREEMLKDLVTDQIDRMIEASDRMHCIYQTRNFIVDEKADVYGCLNLRHDESNRCGNLLTDDINSIMKAIASLHKCDACIASGTSPTDMSFRMFFDGWFHMMKLRDFYEANLDDTQKALGDILLRLRRLENNPSDASDKAEFSHIGSYMEKFGIDERIVKDMIQRYAMRSDLLLERYHRNNMEENIN